MMAHRIQRKRTKGWRMPVGAVYVGRPTKFGNPFLVIHELGETPELAIERYRFWLTRGLPLHGCCDAAGLLPPQPQEIAQLRGKDLVCWCKPGAPCHADVLLELANAPLVASEGA